MLGITVIAMGQSLPDLLTAVALAKQGYAIMALTATYSF